jgi:hypothetical protein
LFLPWPLIADQDLLTGDTAVTQILVCSASLNKRDPLGDQGLDLSLCKKLEKRSTFAATISNDACSFREGAVDIIVMLPCHAAGR